MNPSPIQLSPHLCHVTNFKAWLRLMMYYVSRGNKIYQKLNITKLKLVKNAYLFCTSSSCSSRLAIILLGEMGFFHSGMPWRYLFQLSAIQRLFLRLTFHGFAFSCPSLLFVEFYYSISSTTPFEIKQLFQESRERILMHYSSKHMEWGFDLICWIEWLI